MNFCNTKQASFNPIFSVAKLKGRIQDESNRESSCQSFTSPPTSSLLFWQFTNSRKLEREMKFGGRRSEEATTSSQEIEREQRVPPIHSAMQWRVALSSRAQFLSFSQTLEGGPARVGALTKIPKSFGSLLLSLSLSRSLVHFHAAVCRVKMKNWPYLHVLTKLCTERRRHSWAIIWVKRYFCESDWRMHYSTLHG